MVVERKQRDAFTSATERHIEVGDGLQMLCYNEKTVLREKYFPLKRIAGGGKSKSTWSINRIAKYHLHLSTGVPVKQISPFKPLLGALPS